MNDIILNNGEKCYINKDFLSGPNHSLIFYKDIKSVSFDTSNSGGFISNLLGLSKAQLVIIFKENSYSDSTKTIYITVKKSEFQMVNNLVSTINSAIVQEKANQERIRLATEKRLAKEKQLCDKFNQMLQSIAVENPTLDDSKCLRQQAMLSPYESSANITKKTNPKKYKDFVVIDTETTGIKTSGNDIIEVSAIKFIDCIPTKIYTTLLKPRKPIPADATKINGITNEMVENAPSFAQIRNSLQAFIGTLPIVCHNAEFDIEFLHVSGLEFQEKQCFYDTLELSRKHIRDSLGDKLDNYKLATVCNYCDIYFDGSHRASADALATGLLFIEIIQTIRDCYSVEDILKVAQ